jgi:hypothetical protein
MKVRCDPIADRRVGFQRHARLGLQGLSHRRDMTLTGGLAMGRRRDAKWQATSWFSPDAEFEVKSTSTNPTDGTPNWSRTA